MRWDSGRRSQNVEDRRGMTAGRGIAGGGIGAIVLVVVALLLGVDPSIVLQGLPEEPAGRSVPGEPLRPDGSDRLAEFVSVVLADTEDTWRELFQAINRRYSEPRLVLFSHAVDSACGFAQAAVGPFYCPRDQAVYIDLAFYDDLKNRFQAPGDFAQAYVIAHEVGHHVQSLLGITQRAQELQSRLGQADANAVSVRVELQADCFAGVWAHHADRTRGILEAGDVEEALGAASAIGDDRLQRRSRGQIAPDSFTHGTSAQRVSWFRRGLDGGSVQQCDTFAADRL
jgi:predicted metalloprotease